MNAPFTSPAIAQTAAEVARQQRIAKQIADMEALIDALSECVDTLKVRKRWTPTVQFDWFEVCKAACAVFENGDAARALDEVSFDLRIDEDGQPLRGVEP